jgi:hypothetical protein
MRDICGRLKFHFLSASPRRRVSNLLEHERALLEIVPFSILMQQPELTANEINSHESCKCWKIPLVKSHLKTDDFHFSFRLGWL